MKKSHKKEKKNMQPAQQELYSPSWHKTGHTMQDNADRLDKERQAIKAECDKKIEAILRQNKHLQLHNELLTNANNRINGMTPIS
jgi:hypothetical protein